MLPDGLTIRHGELVDITGAPLRHSVVTFVPAMIKLFGHDASTSVGFLDWCHEKDRVVPQIVGGEDNAPWVWGRLLYLFNLQNPPEEELPDKSCLYASFVAVMQGSQTLAVPFECTDYYCQTKLYFSSEDAPDPSLQDSIATAFFDLLLTNSDELVDYENRMFHCGSGDWCSFGVCQGEPYFDTL